MSVRIATFIGLLLVGPFAAAQDNPDQQRRFLPVQRVFAASEAVATLSLSKVEDAAVILSLPRFSQKLGRPVTADDLKGLFQYGEATVLTKYDGNLKERRTVALLNPLLNAGSPASPNQTVLAFLRKATTEEQKDTTLSGDLWIVVPAGVFGMLPLATDADRQECDAVLTLIVKAAKKKDRKNDGGNTKNSASDLDVCRRLLLSPILDFRFSGLDLPDSSLATLTDADIDSALGALDTALKSDPSLWSGAVSLGLDKLSRTGSPKVSTYLLEKLTAGFPAGLLIGALVNTGTPEAKAQLLALLDSTDGPAAVTAAQALSNLPPDPTLVPALATRLLLPLPATTDKGYMTAVQLKGQLMAALSGIGGDAAVTAVISFLSGADGKIDDLQSIGYGALIAMNRLAESPKVLQLIKDRLANAAVDELTVVLEALSNPAGSSQKFLSDVVEVMNRSSLGVKTRVRAIRTLVRGFSAFKTDVVAALNALLADANLDAELRYEAQRAVNDLK